MQSSKLQRIWNRMKVTPKEIMEGLIFPVEAYSRRGSKEIINAIKRGDINTVKKLVARDKYLLYIHVRLAVLIMFIVQRQTNPSSLGSKTEPAWNHRV